MRVGTSGEGGDVDEDDGDDENGGEETGWPSFPLLLPSSLLDSVPVHLPSLYPSLSNANMNINEVNFETGYQEDKILFSLINTCSIHGFTLDQHFVFRILKKKSRIRFLLGCARCYEGT